MWSPNEMFGRLFTVGLDVLSVTVDAVTGLISGQLGDSTRGIPDGGRVEFWYPPGFAGTPAAPTQGNTSCQAVGLRRSDYNIVFAFRDTRTAKINADLAVGEAALYAPAGSATNGRVVGRKDGTLELLTTKQVSVGGRNPADAAALASVVNRMGNATKQLATALAAVAVNGGTGDVSGASWPAVVTAAQNLEAAVADVSSAVLKVSS